MRLGLGLGIGVGGAQAWTPRALTAISGVQSLWVADYGITAGVAQIDDQSGNLRHLTSSGVNQPTLSAAAINSRAALSFDDTNDRLIHSTAATWKFLHDGTGMTAMFVIKPTGAAASDVIVDTTTNGSLATVGLIMYYDAPNQRIVLQISDGSGVAVVSAALTASTVPRNATHLITVSYVESRAPDEWTMSLNGTQVMQGNSARAPSAANPANPLAIGACAAAATTLSYSGLIAMGATWNKGFSAAELLSAQTSVKTYYGIA